MTDTVKKNALLIIKRLREAGFNAILVGGVVRDIIMGIKPEDYDIATDASPSDVERLFDRVVPIGKQFGVSIIILDGKSYEVARFRMDGIYEDGRRPSWIEPSTMKEDVKRRDFTINALMYDPFDDRVIDYVGGREDIRDRIIRTVGNPDQRFSEDLLRMLRGVRFAAQFDFTIERNTLDALRRHAPEILSVSSERIGEELMKMFTCDTPNRALTLLDETGLLDVVLPEVAVMKGVRQPPEFHPEGDVFEHTRNMLEISGGGTVSLAFGILLHDVGKPVTFTETDRIRFNRHAEAGAVIAADILGRLRFSREIIDRVCALVKNHMRFADAQNMRRSTLKRFIDMEGFEEMLELYRLECLVKHSSLEIYEFVKNTMEHEKDKPCKPLINGDDLIELGYEPGHLFGKIIRNVMDAQLDGVISNREEAIEFVLRDFPPGGKKLNR
ncbi:CCA tRNA nucleotidyltransferase [Candidatus Latescibacterota bacterium]